MKIIKIIIFYASAVIMLPIMAVVFAGQSVFEAFETLGTGVVKGLKKLLITCDKDTPTTSDEKDEKDEKDVVFDEEGSYFEEGMAPPVGLIRYMLEKGDLSILTSDQHIELRKLLNDYVLKSIETQFMTANEKGGEA